MRKSLQLSLTAVFSALHATLYIVSFGLWRNWGIYLGAIEGIFLGPKVGFLAAILGSSIGRIARPDPLFWMFGVAAEPIGVLTAGLLSRGRWRPVLVIYAALLSAFFAHPFGRALPIWTLLDIFVALILILPTAKLSDHLFEFSHLHSAVALVLVSFISIATDSLVRVFLLVPCGLYGSFLTSFEELYALFVGAAVDSYIEDFIVVVFSLLVGLPLLLLVSKLKILDRSGKMD